ncbi:hypothetical protein Ancab_005990 [Ancistrocladus abbreviatus]
MAATMHVKMNRRKLAQIDIVKICEEILNPSVPMALRLSGILMDDVTRFLAELNQAWKVKPASDPTILPKGKMQARYTAVTLPLPDYQDMDLEETEQLMHFSDKLPARHVEDLYKNLMEEELTQHHHQAETANITLFDPFDEHRTETGPYDQYERFDVEGDEETQYNFLPDEPTEIPTSLAHSPPSREGQKGCQFRDEIFYQDLEPRHTEPPNDLEDAKQCPKQFLPKQRPTRRKAKRSCPFMIDDEQIIVPGNVYQSWLQNASDVTRRGKKRKRVNVLSTMKMANLMDLPPLVLLCDLIRNDGQIHYPAPLLQLWKTSVQPLNDSVYGRTSPPCPPEPSSSTPPYNRQHHQHPMEFDLGDFYTGIGLKPASVEKQRDAHQLDLQIHEPGINLMPNAAGESDSYLITTPNSPGNDVRSFSIPSSSSGHGLGSKSIDDNSLRSKKRPFSSSRQGEHGLDPVDEENQWAMQHEGSFFIIEEQAEPSSKLARRPQNRPTSDQELFVETGPTQTQHPVVDEDTENRTNTIRMHLKAYFETPGAPQAESLNQLAYGMNKKRAAQLFYQTCGNDFIHCIHMELLQFALFNRHTKYDCSVSHPRFPESRADGGLWRHSHLKRTKNVTTVQVNLMSTENLQSLVICKCSYHS